MRDEERQIIDDTNALADKLESGSKVTQEEMNQGLAHLRTQLQQWDEEFGMKKK